VQHIGHVSLRLARALLASAAFAALVLAVAGRRDLPMVNALVGVCAAFALFAALRVDPELLRERLRRHQTGEDPRRLAFIRALFPILFVVALLDVGRFHWSDSVPRALQLAGLGLMAAAFALILWSMTANRFFVPVIRLQPERGHQVVSSGPYARVRHPGYAGMALAAPASALALGSWWALLPALTLATLFVARAAHEDQFLLGHLEGYAAYTARVPWRLVPGVW
jgi:protein-S-isoprenylcysteine O-methyltransferase Ste14